MGGLRQIVPQWRALAPRVLRRGARFLLRATVAAILLFLLAGLVLVVGSCFVSLPAGLGSRANQPSVRVLDRHGVLIRTIRRDDGALSTRVRLADVAPEVVSALIAAEDARFYRHAGVDPIAMVRAAAQALWHRHIVSGASTLTQQLARAVVARPRTLRGKIREMLIALRIERSLTKDQILEEYLNQIEFGPNLRGIEAAARFYFDKPASKLDWSEAATLAAIPRGPTLYDPRRGLDRVRRRRDRILDRLERLGFASHEVLDRARNEATLLQASYAAGGAEHFARALMHGKLLPAFDPQQFPNEIVSTLDLNLEREVRAITAATVAELAHYDATAASVIVVDNSSGDVLAYVGSPDFGAFRALGQNDGVLALRQPGSALKPFVYAASMQWLGSTPATVLPDVELHLATPNGDYVPRNYDGQYHGPVLLREALASSLNVPAVYTASRVGPEHVLELLRRAGFHSLKLDADHYGAALALGDGEVTLAELARAYAVLARRGEDRELNFALRATLSSGELRSFVGRTPRRVLDPVIADLITDILADDQARAASFGRGNVLEMPFAVAAKTGTSKAFRDNWCVGYTREVTVAVWVGNFDGRPMRGSSGITGAGPLFRDVMLAAMRGRNAEPLVDRNEFVAAEVCALSGELATADCPEHRREVFAPGHEPKRSCEFHVRSRVDRRSGLRAGRGCVDAIERVYERYPPQFVNWAVAARRPLLPHEYSPRCPGADQSDAHEGSPQITFPTDGARFVLDPALSRSSQELVISAAAPSNARTISFIVDGHRVGRERPPFATRWALATGTHQVTAEDEGGRRSEPVNFVVE